MPAKADCTLYLFSLTCPKCGGHRVKAKRDRRQIKVRQDWVCHKCRVAVEMVEVGRHTPPSVLRCQVAEKAAKPVVKPKIHKPKVRKPLVRHFASGEAQALIVGSCEVGERVTLGEVVRRSGIGKPSVERTLQSPLFERAERGVYFRVGSQPREAK